jgi:hypothetical protein
LLPSASSIASMSATVCLDSLWSRRWNGINVDLDPLQLILDHLLIPTLWHRHLAHRVVSGNSTAKGPSRYSPGTGVVTKTVRLDPPVLSAGMRVKRNAERTFPAWFLADRGAARRSVSSMRAAALLDHAWRVFLIHSRHPPVHHITVAQLCLDQRFSITVLVRLRL